MKKGVIKGAIELMYCRKTGIVLNYLQIRSPDNNSIFFSIRIKNRVQFAVFIGKPEMSVETRNE